MHNDATDVKRQEALEALVSGIAGDVAEFGMIPCSTLYLALGSNLEAYNGLEAMLLASGKVRKVNNAFVPKASA